MILTGKTEEEDEEGGGGVGWGGRRATYESDD